MNHITQTEKQLRILLTQILNKTRPPSDENPLLAARMEVECVFGTVKIINKKYSLKTK